MSGLFGGGSSPKMPAPVAPPPTPTIDDAARNRDMNDVMRRRKGRAAALYAGKNGGGKDATSAAKILTGD